MCCFRSDSTSRYHGTFSGFPAVIYTLRGQIPPMAGDSSELPQILCQGVFKDQQVILTDDPFFEKVILSLALDGTASVEGILRFLENIFHKHVSIGSISTVLNRAADRAEQFHRTVGLSGICQGANDEILQCQHPVLTGIDPVSTYTYLLEQAFDRSADTWAHAMERCRERNLNLEVSISDFGNGLLSGIPKVFTGIGFQGDLFHWLTEIGKEVSSQKRKAYAQLSEYYQKLESLSGQRVHEKTFQRLSALEKQLSNSMETSDLLQILYGWLREAVQPQGYPCWDVSDLCTWILDQMEAVPGITSRFQKALGKTRKHLPDVLVIPGTD